MKVKNTQLSSNNNKSNKNKKKRPFSRNISRSFRLKKKREKLLEKSLANLNLFDYANNNKKKDTDEDCNSVIVIDDSITSDNVNNTVDNDDVIEIIDDSITCDDLDVIYLGKVNTSDINTINERTVSETISVDKSIELNTSQVPPFVKKRIDSDGNNMNIPYRRVIAKQSYPSVLHNNLNFIPLNVTRFIPNDEINTININQNSFVTMNHGNHINRFGDNIYNAGTVKKNGLRMIIIDGSNVAMGHSNGKFFSVKGLKICIDYFLKRRHEVVAFVPQFRLKDNESSDPKLLRQLQKDGHVVVTPSRDLDRIRICSYDDRFIVQCAAENDGIIVSSDNFRDLMKENIKWKQTIEQRLLMPTWVNDIIMFPKDPLGKRGPDLDDFLKFPSN